MSPQIECNTLRRSARLIGRDCVVQPQSRAKALTNTPTSWNVRITICLRSPDDGMDHSGMIVQYIAESKTDKVLYDCDGSVDLLSNLERWKRSFHLLEPELCILSIYYGQCRSHS